MDLEQQFYLQMSSGYTSTLRGKSTMGTWALGMHCYGSTTESLLTYNVLENSGTHIYLVLNTTTRRYP